HLDAGHLLGRGGPGGGRRAPAEDDMPRAQTRRVARPLILLLLTLLTPIAAPAADDEPYDLVLRNGRVVDGTGNPWYYGDVAVRGDRIVRVSRLPEGTRARRTIDARGLVVAPGFIDM